MNRQHRRPLCIVHYALCIAFAVVAANADMLLDTDADFAFALDTLGSPRIVGELSPAQSIRYLEGQSVTIAAPDGAVSTPISSAASSGAYGWTPNAPGTWTLVNDGEGEAVFDVRYSLFPASAGGGTEANPAKAVDGDDLAALIAGGTISDGGYFVPGGSSSVESFAQPNGHAFSDAGNGLWQLVASSGGLLFSSLSPMALDTVLPGPDRKMHKREAMPLAWSGDLWTGTNAAMSATLTVAHATDGRPAQTVSGLGSTPFSPRRAGQYTVTLDDGATVLTSHINVPDDATTLFLR